MKDVSSRRRFLEVIATSGAALGAACLGAGCVSGGPTGKIAGGNVSDLVVPSLKAVPGASVAVGRDAEGLYAMTLICTHAGCDMESQGSVAISGVVCSCHGSVFDADGQVVQGPANSPLEHFEVTVDAKGAITVNADKTVDASVRVAV